MTTKIDCYYDEQAKIAWLRCADCEPVAVVAEETEFGLEVDPSDRHVVGLEYWRASERLLADVLRMLPPPISVAR